MSLQALRGYILAEDVHKAKSEGGRLWLPDKRKKRPLTEFKALSVGANKFKKGREIPCNVNPGDIIHVKPYSPQRIREGYYRSPIVRVHHADVIGAEAPK